MRECDSVRKTEHGKFTVSTVYNPDARTFETRIFNKERRTWLHADIPEKLLAAIDATEWLDTVDVFAYVLRDNGYAVESLNTPDAHAVHSKFMELVTAYNTGTLA